MGHRCHVTCNPVGSVIVTPYALAVAVHTIVASGPVAQVTHLPDQYDTRVNGQQYEELSHDLLPALQYQEGAAGPHFQQGI